MTKPSPRHFICLLQAGKLPRSKAAAMQERNEGNNRISAKMGPLSSCGNLCQHYAICKRCSFANRFAYLKNLIDLCEIAKFHLLKILHNSYMWLYVLCVGFAFCIHFAHLWYANGMLQATSHVSKCNCKNEWQLQNIWGVRLKMQITHLFWNRSLSQSCLWLSNSR